LISTSICDYEYEKKLPIPYGAVVDLGKTQL